MAESFRASGPEMCAFYFMGEEVLRQLEESERSALRRFIEFFGEPGYLEERAREAIGEAAEDARMGEEFMRDAWRRYDEYLQGTEYY